MTTLLYPQCHSQTCIWSEILLHCVATQTTQAVIGLLVPYVFFLDISVLFPVIFFDINTDSRRLKMSANFSMCKSLCQKQYKMATKSWKEISTNVDLDMAICRVAQIHHWASIHAPNNFRSVRRLGHRALWRACVHPYIHVNPTCNALSRSNVFGRAAACWLCKPASNCSLREFLLSSRNAVSLSSGASWVGCVHYKNTHVRTPTRKKILTFCFTWIVLTSIWTSFTLRRTATLLFIYIQMTPSFWSLIGHGKVNTGLEDFVHPHP